MWCKCTMEYYSAIKKYEILPFATTWMDLEGLWYVKLKNTEKDKYCYYLHGESKNKNK